MSTANIQIVANLLGNTIPVSLAVSDDGAGQWTPAIAAAPAGTLTTRTDDGDGVATLTTGHGIVTDDVVTVSWVGGSRYNMTATVATNAVTLAGGAGSALPAAETAVTVCRQVAVAAAFNAAELEAFMVTTNYRASLVFVTAAGAVLLALDLAAGACCLWWTGSGITLPLTGSVAQILVANEDPAGNIANVTVSVIYNATP